MEHCISEKPETQVEVDESDETFQQNKEIAEKLQAIDRFGRMLAVSYTHLTLPTNREV